MNIIRYVILCTNTITHNNNIVPIANTIHTIYIHNIILIFKNIWMLFTFQVK